MMVAIIGTGNMASRYSAILRKYRVHHHMFDIGNWRKSAEYNLRYDRYIVASSTVAHVENLQYLLSKDCEVLCEKPITKNFDELVDLCNNYRPFQVVNQYRHLIDPKKRGVTYYDYFKTGGDGLAWDLISVIGLASDRPTISNKSPVWTCQINNQKLNIKDMDQAYCKEISDFLAKPEHNTKYMLEAHHKVQEGWYTIC